MITPFSTPTFARRQVHVAALALLVLGGGLLSLTRPGGAEPLEPAQAPATGKEVLVVKADDETKTIDAKGQDVTVNGNRNKLTITGECHALTITGQFNFVNVEAVASITLSGSGNEVAYKKTVDGEKPQITDTGKDNVIAKTKVE